MESAKSSPRSRRGDHAILWGSLRCSQGDVQAVSSTAPLFVMLAGAYCERTGDRLFAESMWPSIDAALAWIDRFGDQDGDGFVEYARQHPAGLLNQSWKDADDAIVHGDGRIAAGPIAMSEVQGYAYGARRSAAAVAMALGFHERAATLRDQAEGLRASFNRAFWCDDIGTYGLALDGHKQPCRMRTSNAGQCLFSGIVDAQRAPLVARALFDDDGFSGRGFRTLAAGQARYNPLGYHTGAVWPHDNALIAQELANYGCADEARRIQDATFEASLHFDLERMPELFCGFPRTSEGAPVPYPLACAPQAWAAGSVLLLLQSVLGLQVDGCHRQGVFSRPRLLEGLEELSIHGLAVCDGRVDLRIVRHGRGARVEILQRSGAVEVVVT